MGAVILDEQFRQLKELQIEPEGHSYKEEI